MKPVKIEKKYGDRIEVCWTDACERSGWRSVEDALKVPDEVFVRTIGFYLGHTKEFLTLANSIGKSEKNDVSGIWHIPVKWITKLK